MSSFVGTVGNVSSRKFILADIKGNYAHKKNLGEISTYSYPLV